MANAEHLKILKEGVERWNRWREENKRIKPDLSTFTDLSGAHLNFAQIIDTDLRYAFLIGTNLLNACLLNANLHRANLNHADMRMAGLIGANLSETDMCHANLYLANLTRADLSGTLLNSAKVGNTVFGRTDLSTSIGLETMIVEAPCTIDFQTLRISKNIPKSFLLKIGLPENYINYLPDFYENEGIKFYPAFLSHAHANKPFARKLYEALIGGSIRNWNWCSRKNANCKRKSVKKPDF